MEAGCFFSAMAVKLQDNGFGTDFLGGVMLIRLSWILVVYHSA